MMRRRYVTLALAACALLLIPTSGLGSEVASDLPETFTARVLTVGGPRLDSKSLKLTINRWSTVEEREGLLKALQEGKTDGLTRAMEKLEAGYIQIENNLRWPVRVATTWQTEEGRMIRVATNRPMGYGEHWRKRGTDTTDYPIGVVELKLPAEGKGEGTLLAATKIRFDDQGRIEILSLPQNYGPQQVVDVKPFEPKQKKKKKNKKKKEKK